MKKYVFIFAVLPFFYSCNSSNKDEVSDTKVEKVEEETPVEIPNHLKNRRISYIMVPETWIEISSDNVLTFHEHINNSDEDFEFKAKIGEYNPEEFEFELTFLGENTYQGRNDYKPTEVLPKLGMIKGNNDLRIYTKGFNTIKGSLEEHAMCFRL